MRTRRGIGKDQRNVFGPHIAAIGTIGRSSTSLNPTGNLDFMIVVIGNRADRDIIAITFGRNRDLSEIPRRSRSCPSEDHVFHTRTAH